MVQILAYSLRCLPLKLKEGLVLAFMFSIMTIFASKMKRGRSEKLIFSRIWDFHLDEISEIVDC